MSQKSLRFLIAFSVAASALLGPQMTRAQGVAPQGPDFVYIGQVYGESQSGNFQQDKFLLLPHDFDLDTSYEQRGGVQCCGGGAQSDWDYKVPLGIYMTTGGGHYWSITRPGLDATERDAAGNVRQWRFGVFMYCGPEPPVGCNVKVNVWAKRKYAPVGAGLLCAGEKKVFASEVPISLGPLGSPPELADHRPLRSGLEIEVIDKTGAPLTGHDWNGRSDNVPIQMPSNVEQKQGDCWVFGDYSGSLQLRRVTGKIVRLKFEDYSGTLHSATISGTRLSPLPAPTPRPSPPVPPPPSPPPAPSPPPSPPASGAPNCGSVPCLSILAESGKNCGSFTAMVLVNHASKTADLKVLVTVQGNTTWTRVETYSAAPGSSTFLGCSGSVSPMQRGTIVYKAA